MKTSCWRREKEEPKDSEPEAWPKLAVAGRYQLSGDEGEWRKTDLVSNWWNSTLCVEYAMNGEPERGVRSRDTISSDTMPLTACECARLLGIERKNRAWSAEPLLAPPLIRKKPTVPLS